MRNTGSQGYSIPFELQSLADAHSYQHWLADITLPFLGRRILELGSGIGNLSQHLPTRELLVLSDIDESLVNFLRGRFEENEKRRILRLTGLTDPSLATLDLDTIVSYNVMEHVEDDAVLLREAISLLRRSRASGPKRLVSLVPAHQWAYSPVDRQFGHFRRYNRASFRSVLERAGEKVDSSNFRSFYLNIPGLVGWWFNGCLLGRDTIGTGNLKAFEALYPVIRPLDDFLHWLGIPLGNSLVTVFEIKDA